VADNMSGQPAASKLLNGLILREGVQQQSARRNAAHCQNDFGLAHLDLHPFHTMRCLKLLACQVLSTCTCFLTNIAAWPGHLHVSVMLVRHLCSILDIIIMAKPMEAFMYCTCALAELL